MDTSFQSRGEMLQATLYHVSSSAGVILCPPHPVFGGDRNDTRIVRVAKELAAQNISALCMDYESYRKGVKEVQNALDAVAYMQKKTDSLGLFGYSFGAVVAYNAAAQAKLNGFVAMSILKNVDGLKTDLDFDCPKLLIHGKHVNVAPYKEFESLYEQAKDPKEKLIIETDHFYMEDYPTTIEQTAKSIRTFFERILSKNLPCTS